ncbi:MAG TPA: hypothetical protein VMB04_20360 [Mycobacterium sp.]|nr:hypothetical protein [Mycobacterium sp.]
MVMFAKTKQVVALGVTVVALGWVTVASPGVAHSQPPRMPQGDNVTCPDIAGINYVPDPEDSHGFYLCVDGLMRHHFRCPQVTVLVMGIPPKCVPFLPVRP